MDTFWQVLIHNWPGYTVPILMILACELANVLIFKRLQASDKSDAMPLRDKRGKP